MIRKDQEFLCHVGCPHTLWRKCGENTMGSLLTKAFRRPATGWGTILPFSSVTDGGRPVIGIKFGYYNQMIKIQALYKL